MTYKRPHFSLLMNRLKEPRHFIQVLAGPRQVGKTTLALQIQEAVPVSCHYASADEAMVHQPTWLQQQWDVARLKCQEGNTALLILDEIQKIQDWSSLVKKLWDEDTRHHCSLHVMILGSSALLIQQGLRESLAGRFEVTPVSHWGLSECQEAFGWSVDQYIYFGGYPGAAPLIQDENRWQHYIKDSLIETCISRDILLETKITKPFLLRRLFELTCLYSGQILSYQKMLGQLQDVGNAATLAHYLELLSQAGMVTGLQKFTMESFRQKASSPKLHVLNTALMSAQNSLSFQQALYDRNYWGRLVESAVGAHLLNQTRGTEINLLYWREGNREVDFILKKGQDIVALEVKSHKQPTALPGIQAFQEKFKPKRSLLVGGQGISVEAFLKTNVSTLF